MPVIDVVQSVNGKAREREFLLAFMREMNK